MKKIFISYSRKDLNFVDELAKDLTEAGYDVWYDLTDLEGGDHWADELQAAINESQVYVLVISPNSVASDWVEKEFIYAGGAGKRIVPLLHVQTALPLWLVNLHYVDIQGRNYKKNFQHILAALEDEDVPLPPPKTGLPKLSPAWIGGIAGGVVLLLAAIFGLPALMRGGTPTPEATQADISLASPPTDTPAPIIEIVMPTSTTVEETPTPQVSPTPAPEITDDKGAEMVLIPGGSFKMGNERGAPDERPLHIVSTNPFYMDKYEVTNAQYRECVLDEECELPDPTRLYTDSRLSDHPVVYMSWEMASVYCTWRGARLPTEAEWEKAARGDELIAYPWGNDFDGNRLNFCDLNCTENGADRAFNDGFDTTAPVGSYPDGVSPYGVFDMAGNVTEWVADWYASDYYEGSPNQNPPGPESGTFRVLRGGSWLDNRDAVTTFKRAAINPVTAVKYIGFRCARDVSP